MGRENTFKDTPSPFDDMLNEELPEETLGSIVEASEDETIFDLDSLPKRKEAEVVEPKPVKKTKRKEATIPFLDFEARETVRKTFVIDKEIDDVLNSLVIDRKTGRRLPGRKGILSKIVNNALIKEFVELQLLDESALEDLESL